MDLYELGKETNNLKEVVKFMCDYHIGTLDFAYKYEDNLYNVTIRKVSGDIQWDTKPRNMEEPSSSPES